MNQNNSNWKKLLGFRNMQEKLENEIWGGTPKIDNFGQNLAKLMQSK